MVLSSGKLGTPKSKMAASICQWQSQKINLLELKEKKQQIKVINLLTLYHWSMKLRMIVLLKLKITNKQLLKEDGILFIGTSYWMMNWDQQWLQLKFEIKSYLILSWFHLHILNVYIEWLNNHLIIIKHTTTNSQL